MKELEKKETLLYIKEMLHEIHEAKLDDKQQAVEKYLKQILMALRDFEEIEVANNVTTYSEDIGIQ